MHETKSMPGAITQIPTYHSLWIYILGPLCGGILAGLLSKLDEVARAASGLSSVHEDINMKAATSVNYNSIGGDF